MDCSLAAPLSSGRKPRNSSANGSSPGFCTSSGRKASSQTGMPSKRELHSSPAPPVQGHPATCVNLSSPYFVIRK